MAYHITEEYRNTPPRESIFDTFLKDPDIDNEPSDSDYIGLLATRGYVRGYLAPLAVMGGDRDGAGKVASLNGVMNDPDDALTIGEGNYMTSISPQCKKGFNNSQGLWRKLEDWIQTDLVDSQGREVWIFAGCIFGPGHHEKVTNKTVWGPPMFYKIVIMKIQMLTYRMYWRSYSHTSEWPMAKSKIFWLT